MVKTRANNIKKYLNDNKMEKALQTFRILDQEYKKEVLYFKDKNSQNLLEYALSKYESGNQERFLKDNIEFLDFTSELIQLLKDKNLFKIIMRFKSKPKDEQKTFDGRKELRWHIKTMQMIKSIEEKQSAFITETILQQNKKKVLIHKEINKKDFLHGRDLARHCQKHIAPWHMFVPPIETYIIRDKRTNEEVYFSDIYMACESYLNGTSVQAQIDSECHKSHFENRFQYVKNKKKEYIIFGKTL